MEMVAQNGQLNLSGLMMAKDFVTPNGGRLLGEGSADRPSLYEKIQALEDKVDMLMYALLPSDVTNAPGPPLRTGIHFVAGYENGQPSGLVTVFDPDADTYDVEINQARWFRARAASVVCNNSLWVLGGHGRFRSTFLFGTIAAPSR